MKALAPVPQARESFADSIVGVRTGSGLSENWLALVSAAVDGFGIGSDYSWNVEGYVGYRMSATGCTMFGIPTVLSLGYLALHQKHQLHPILDVTDQFSPCRAGEALRR